MSARQIRWGAAIAALVTSAALAPAPAIGANGHHHGPSAAAVARSKQQVASRQHQVAIAARALGQAKQQLNRLNVKAETAFEAYDGAKVKLAAAERAVQTAHAVLAGANDRVAKGQASAIEFATAAYKTGGLSNLAAYLEPGGAARKLKNHRASSASHVAVQNLITFTKYSGMDPEVGASSSDASGTYYFGQGVDNGFYPPPQNFYDRCKYYFLIKKIIMKKKYEIKLLH